MILRVFEKMMFEIRVCDTSLQYRPHIPQLIIEVSSPIIDMEGFILLNIVFIITEIIITRALRLVGVFIPNHYD